VVVVVVVVVSSSLKFSAANVDSSHE
jgi:hypothetical protein